MTKAFYSIYCWPPNVDLPFTVIPIEFLEFMNTLSAKNPKLSAGDPGKIVDEGSDPFTTNGKTCQRLPSFVSVTMWSARLRELPFRG